jgi:uncharacterized protein DUF4349
MRAPDLDPELVRLEEDLRAIAPQADPAFLAALQERVAAGFPRPEPARRSGRSGRGGFARPLAVAAAALAALVVAAIVLAPGRRADEAGSAGGGTGRPDAGPVQEAAGGAAPRDSEPNAQLARPPLSASGAQPAAPSPAPPAAAQSRGDRRVERAAQLTLTPPADEVQSVAEGVTHTTQELGGYVESSQVTTNGQGGSGSLRLRIPSARLASAIERLSALAPVGSLSQGATDITGATGSAAERVADARGERTALLRALGRATTDREIASLRERLRLNRSRLARARGALESLRRRARLSTVDVTVRASADGNGGSDGGGAWTPRDALGDALRVLQVAAGVALVGAAALVPALVLGGAGVLAGRVVTRRRREQALDAT